VGGFPVFAFVSEHGQADDGHRWAAVDPIRGRLRSSSAGKQGAPVSLVPANLGTVSRAQVIRSLVASWGKITLWLDQTNGHDSRDTPDDGSHDRLPLPPALLPQGEKEGS